MKPALIIISSRIEKEPVSKTKYLGACIDRVAIDGFTPITPCSWEAYQGMSDAGYVKQMMPIIRAIYFFVDFGVDISMHDMVQSYYKRAAVNIRRMGREFIKTIATTKTIEHILSDVSERSCISIETLKGKCRQREIVIARQYYFRRSREMTKSSLSAIGALVGKDHATVLHGIKTINNTFGMIEEYQVFFGDKKPEEKIKQITAEIKAKTPIPLIKETVRRPDAIYSRYTEENSTIRPFSGYRPHSL
jgi:hypothetical protein